MHQATSQQPQDTCLQPRKSCMFIWAIALSVTSKASSCRDVAGLKSIACCMLITLAIPRLIAAQKTDEAERAARTRCTSQACLEWPVGFDKSDTATQSC